jgi:hypothetical protein
MAESLLNAGFWLCDFVYAILESIQARYFPQSIQVIKFTAFPSPFISTLHSLLSDSEIPQTEEYEPLRVLVIGSTDGVTETIHNLHARGFAEVSAWSTLLPAPNPGEVMSILSRQRRK